MNSHPVSSVGLFTLPYILSFPVNFIWHIHRCLGAQCILHHTGSPPPLQRAPLRMPSDLWTLWWLNPLVHVFLSAFSFVRFSVLPIAELHLLWRASSSSLGSGSLHSYWRFVYPCLWAERPCNTGGLMFSSLTERSPNSDGVSAGTVWEGFICCILILLFPTLAVIFFCCL